MVQVHGWFLCETWSAAVDRGNLDGIVLLILDRNRDDCAYVLSIAVVRE
jgi:hypothetical protein